MKIPIVNHIILILGAMCAQWLFAAITARSWHPVFILLAIVILVRTTKVHQWLWEIIALGLMLDILSVHPIGVITFVLIICAFIIRILKRFAFPTISTMTLIAQGIIALISYSTIFFIVSRLLEYFQKTQSIYPFLQYFFSYEMIIELLLISIFLPMAYSLFIKQRKRSSLYAKRSL